MNAIEQLSALNKRFNKVLAVMEDLGMARRNDKSWANFGGWKIIENILFQQEERVRDYGEKTFMLSDKQLELIDAQIKAQVAFINAIIIERKAAKVAATPAAEVAEVVAEIPTVDSKSQTIWDILDTKEKELSPLEYSKWLYPDTPLYGEMFEEFDEEEYTRDMRDLESRGLL